MNKEIMKTSNNVATRAKEFLELTQSIEHQPTQRVEEQKAWRDEIIFALRRSEIEGKCFWKDHLYIRSR